MKRREERLRLVMFDMARFRKRFIGPMVIPRGKLSQFTKTESMDRVLLRRGDSC